MDGQSVEDFAREMSTNVKVLLKELQEKSYRPYPVKRCEILKPDGGTRKLGIPAVRDRVVQQALLEIMQPLFDPGFHPSSYGYRPGKSSHQAMEKASLFIRKYHLKWVVDLDLSKCFDSLDHGLILDSIRKKIRDGSILNLVKMFLESGVMTEEGWEASEEGSPQGGVISPLIANIYLDAFDQFMKGRGKRIVRYADDILILCRSRKGAENALDKARSFLENDLRLKVNQEKTHVCHSHTGVKFLGFQIGSKVTWIQKNRLKRLKAKVKILTVRNNGKNLDQTVKELNPVIRGFANYFRIANCKGVFEDLMTWIRRRLRAKQMKLWKKATRLHRRLRQLGYKGKFRFIKMNSWRNARSPLSHYAMPNEMFHLELKLFDMSAVEFGISCL